MTFSEYADTEEILSVSYRLKGSACSVGRDYQHEIVEARKRLLPAIRQARDARKKTIVKYPARLVVNWQTIVDEFPDWGETMKMDRIESITKREQRIT